MIRASLVLAVVVAPVVTASGVLESPLVIISLDNGHSEKCLDGITGLCLFAGSANDLGDAEIDADQRLRYVHVALNSTTLASAPGHELLPDAALVVRRQTLEVPNVASTFLGEHVGHRRLPPPFGAYSVRFDERGIGATYRATNLMEGDPSVVDHEYELNYSEDGGVEYETIGPSRDWGDSWTDDRVRREVTGLCHHTRPECYDLSSPVLSEYRRLTPNIHFGLELHEIAAASSPDLLPAPLASRALPEPPALARDALPRLPAPGRAASGPLARDLSPAGAVEDPQVAPRAPLASPQEGEPPLKPLLREWVEHVPPAWGVAAAVAAGFAVALAIAGLYSRFHSPGDMLASARRARIMQLLEERGPMSIAEIARELGCDSTTAGHHVRLLARMDQVARAKRGRRVYVSLPGREPPPFAGDATERLLRTITEAGGSVTRDELHQATPDMPRRTRNHGLRTLLERGAIERAFEGARELLRLRQPG